MQQNPAQEFSYHIGWRSKGRHPGRHSSIQTGLGMEFRGHAPLIAYPDPRRIDLRQTLRDPTEQIHVRMFNQKSSIPVYVVCDLSGSMGFVGERSKLELASDICASVAYSAYRVNDPFGFIGFDDEIREDWLFTSTTKVHGAFELAERLRGYRPTNRGAKGLLDADQFLSRERALVFLISDFHMPAEALEKALNSLMRHHVVPVVLWDGAEYKKLPEFGITSVTDAETGARRTLFLRRGYRERIAEAFEARRTMLRNLLMRYDMPPFFVEERFKADDMTEYFYQFVAA